jgi:hypothetical protein
MSELPSKVGQAEDGALKGRRYILEVGPPKAGWPSEATAGEIQKRRLRPEGGGRDKSRPYMRGGTAGPSLRLLAQAGSG